MAETRSRLAGLCRDQHVGTELIESCESLEQILDRTLAECERRIADDNASVQARLRQIDGLLKLARETNKLQANGSGMDDARQVLLQLERDLSKVEQNPTETLPEQNSSSSPPGAAAVDVELLRDLLGALARLCHKINNPLTSIMGRAQIMQMKLEADTADDKTSRSVQVIEESAKRVAALVQELAGLVCQGSKELVTSYDSSNGSRKP